ESLEEADLLIGEGADLVATSLNVADGHVCFQQRTAKGGPLSTFAPNGTAFRELVDFGLNVSNMDHSPFDHRATTHRSEVECNVTGGHRTVMGDQALDISINAQHHDIKGFT